MAEFNDTIIKIGLEALVKRSISEIIEENGGYDNLSQDITSTQIIGKCMPHIDNAIKDVIALLKNAISESKAHK